jgi:PPOX class probable F420-dependent enzyme
VDADVMRERFGAARVARLATITDQHAPQIVPVCFALEGERIVSVVDQKPKRTTSLRRLDNVRGNPAVSLLVDHYDEDWTQLWWVRADGRGRVLEPGAEVDGLLAPLVEKYGEQYGPQPPRGAAIVVDVVRWVGWSASD